MTLAGTIVEGAIILDQPAELPEGCRVQVVVNDGPDAASGAPPTLLGLLKLAGTAPCLPDDFAEQHDHYIHGMPRR